MYSKERLNYLAQRAIDQEMTYTEWVEWLDTYKALVTR